MPLTVGLVISRLRLLFLAGRDLPRICSVIDRNPLYPSGFIQGVPSVMVTDSVSGKSGHNRAVKQERAGFPVSGPDIHVLKKTNDTRGLELVGHNLGFNVNQVLSPNLRVSDLGLPSLDKYRATCWRVGSP